MGGIQLLAFFGNTKILNLSSLEKGMYFISFQTENGVVTKSIVKE